MNCLKPQDMVTHVHAKAKKLDSNLLTKSCRDMTPENHRQRQMFAPRLSIHINLKLPPHQESWNTNMPKSGDLCWCH
ncbi:unnamed protein product [Periconia digitata]|uniref:Uncharacterized protein n=1 Tax=Periconia digitata TaxID=1303443 RepID=A0A9W4U7M8_9PLEO|nr:unnamed protein product [Periconia digitata]